MRTLICFSLSSTLRPRSVVASLTLDELRAGHEVSVLDVTAFSYVRQDLPPAWFARLCGHRVNHSALGDFFSERRVPFRALDSKEPIAELPNEVEAQLEEAVFSEIVTYFRSDSPRTSSFFVRKTMNRILRQARPAYWALHNYLSTEKPDKVLIPNGRVAHQRMLLLASKDFGTPVEYYETGRVTPMSYYRGRYQVHDREGTQNFVQESTAGLSDKECEKLANDWLALRMASGSPTNPFSARWTSTSQAETKSKKKQRAVFFSSSVDEFASYGKGWLRHEWESQFQAFAAILRKIDLSSTSCALRIHPNLLNKDRAYIQNEIRHVRELVREFPELAVYWHTDPMSSYTLLQSADMVFVGRSTIGLEGSCLGKSVWTTTASRYDICADVRQILSPRDLEETKIEPWNVNRSGAFRFVASMMLQDFPLTVGEENWSSFDSSSGPFCVRLGTLFVGNSLLHRIHLMRLEIRKLINLFFGRILERSENASR